MIEFLVLLKEEIYIPENTAKIAWIIAVLEIGMRTQLYPSSKDITKKEVHGIVLDPKFDKLCLALGLQGMCLVYLDKETRYLKQFIRL